MSVTREHTVAALRQLVTDSKGATVAEITGLLEDAIAILQVGPTGEFPEGKLDGADRGALQIAITAREGRVLIEFGTDVDWLAMSGDQARAIALLLGTNAKRADAQRDEAKQVKSEHARNVQQLMDGPDGKTSH